ncbi:acetoacetate--CoA ligase [Ramlibacter sp. AW1]|uniref:Acetoacetate--CoA ligase n=1 Tax=Ramlibacter aurantiacus TaxID=2801330 RepID=A0A936ZJT7_9BURK|nr:acetoacetate--CoA ligase [Ramlibacter aurantiacus]
MAAFRALLETRTGRTFGDPGALHAFSVAEFRTFWEVLLKWCGQPLGIAGAAEPVCIGDDCEHATFFPCLQLNYADSLLNLEVAGAGAPALTQCHADGSSESWTRGELRERVARLAAALVGMGVGEGDRVVAVMRNDGLAVMAGLAVAAVGATLSTASPEMSVQALLDRFGPLRPRLLFAHLAPLPGDTGTPVDEKLADLARQLDSLQGVVSLDGGPLPDGASVLQLDGLLQARASGSFEWPRFSFNHPLFIMFSSGTTGRPKCIVHGAGGSLLEHVKEHRLHTDLQPGDRLYFHTSCSWMMWNWQLSALASGVEIVTYDGTISSVDRLWRLVSEQRVTVFGTSPAYLKMSQEAQLEPGRQFDLGALRAVLSTGAVLYDAQFDWVTRQVKSVPVQSISGGTDIIGCFVLGHPDRPVVAGEAQSRSLGLDVQAWREGAPAEGVGELVCVNPFPSRPLGFYGDTDGSRFHAAYFSQNPGVWTHGDLIEFSPQGGARLHGRSDGLLNVAGIKFAPAEIYRVLADIPAIREAMVVERRPADASAAGGPEILALLVLRPGAVLDRALEAQVRRDIAARLSAAHVPDRIIDVPQLPVTHNGKVSEAAARAAASGLPLQNLSALRNPECLEAIREHPGLRDAPPAAELAQGEDLLAQLQSVWRQLLGMDVGLEDDFFELGGNSLLAARMMREIQKLTGRSLPLGTLMCAPTVAKLASILSQDTPAAASSMLVRMREGEGRPIFMAHGMNGTTMDCWPLVRALQTGRPVWAFQARGLDGEQAPHERVEEMAQAYIELMRSIQPEGPYALTGFSFGGLVAYEMAQQLIAQGEKIELLFLIDPHLQQDLSAPSRLWHQLTRLVHRLWRMPRSELPRFLQDRVRQAGIKLRVRLGLAPPPRPSAGLAMAPVHQRVFDSLWWALLAYRPAPYLGGSMVFVRSAEPFGPFFDPMPVWRRVSGGRLRQINLPGTHLALVRQHAQPLAAALDAALRASAAPTTT